MILDNSISLEAVLSGAVAANQPEYHIVYEVVNVEGRTTRPEVTRGALNSNTDVTLLAAPPTQNERRKIFEISVYNKDTAAVTITIKTDDGSTERIIHKTLLDAGRTLFWERGVGWYRSQ